MKIKIIRAGNNEHLNWDQYVMGHPQSNLYHLFGWKTVIEKTYSHSTYYLMATCDKQLNKNRDNSSQSVVGILPLVHLKHFLFGNNLISIPYFDVGGMLTEDQEVEKALLSEAMKLGRELHVKFVELRHEKSINQDIALNCFTRSHKVRMLLELPESSQVLMASFKSKLRSQIKRPIKEGLNAMIGGLELLDEFYNVFLINMRDLGSPVHSKKIMRRVLEVFPEQAKIIIIQQGNLTIAGSMIVGFKNMLENPWASSLRQYSRKSPNMLLYWTMLEYACDHGYKYFDFGRSTTDESTYQFKAQWGAVPHQLHWHYISLNGQTIDTETTEKSKFDKAIQYWQKLPVAVTKIIGPMLRKHIGL